MFDLVTIQVLQGSKTEPGNLALNGSCSCPPVGYCTKPSTGNRSFRATDKETPVQTPVQVHTFLTIAAAACGREAPRSPPTSVATRVGMRREPASANPATSWAGKATSSRVGCQWKSGHPRRANPWPARRVRGVSRTEVVFKKKTHPVDSTCRWATVEGGSSQGGCVGGAAGGSVGKSARDAIEGRC